MEMCQDLTERFMFRQPHEKTITFTTVILQFRIHVLLLRESVLFELCCKTLTCQRVKHVNCIRVATIGSSHLLFSFMGAFGRFSPKLHNIFDIFEKAGRS